MWRPEGHADLDGGIGRIEGPFVKGKCLYLQSGLPLKDLLDVFVHEMAHGAGWNLSEEWVGCFASDVAEGLVKIGFRLVGDDEQG